MDIKVGDTVISFDFPDFHREVEGKNACFIQGKVLEIGRPEGGYSCDCYKIEVTKKIFSGKLIEKFETIYYAPVNGTPTMMGKVCSGVIKLS